MRQASEPQLTPREIDLVRGIVEAKTNKIMAFELGLSENSIKVYLARIFTKIGVDSRAELFKWALERPEFIPIDWVLRALSKLTLSPEHRFEFRRAILMHQPALHDEIWSTPMDEVVRAAKDRGAHVRTLTKGEADVSGKRL